MKYCPHFLPQKPATAPICTSAICFQMIEQARDLCNFRFMHNGAKSTLLEINPDEILVSNVSQLILSCQGKRMKTLPCCMYCILHVPCLCSIGAKHMQIPPRMDNCKKVDKIQIIYPINLALLQNVFESSSLSKLFDDTAFQKSLSFEIPTFQLYEHNFSRIISANQKAH